MADNQPFQLHELLEPGAAIPQFSSQASQAALVSLAISMKRIADEICSTPEKSGLLGTIWLAADIVKT